MLKKTCFVLLTPLLSFNSTLYSFNRFDKFGLFYGIEVCCLWRGSNDAFMNTDGLEIIFYRHSNGSYLCLQARSTLHKSNCQMNEHIFLIERNRTFFFQHVLFKWMFDSNDSFSLQFFWIKYNREKYFFFYKSQFAISIAELERFEIKCASRGIQVYRDVCKPKLSQPLEVFPEQGNIYDPFAMVFEVKSAAMLTKTVIGRIPRKISRFCQYFKDYDGLLEARVRHSMKNLANSEQRSWDTRNAYCEKRFNEQRGFSKNETLLGR